MRLRAAGLELQMALATLALTAFRMAALELEDAPRAQSWPSCQAFLHLAGCWAQQPAPWEEFYRQSDVQMMLRGLICSEGAGAELAQTGK